MVSTAATANPLPATSTTVLFPDLMALINQAVQVAVQASQRRPEPAIACPASCLAPVRHPLHPFSPRGRAFSLPYQVPQPQVGPFLWLCLLLRQPLTGQSWQSLFSSSGHILSAFIQCQLLGGSAIRSRPRFFSRPAQNLFCKYKVEKLSTCQNFKRQTWSAPRPSFN